MPEKEKFRKCRNCGKDVKIGEACECGLNEDAEREEARKRIIRRRIEADVEKEMDKPTKRGWLD